LHSSGSRHRSVAGSCKHGNESSGAMTEGEILCLPKRVSTDEGHASVELVYDLPLICAGNIN
jgi:hypothetical protein